MIPHSPSRSRRRPGLLPALLLLLAALAPAPAPAQDGLSDMLFTAGTTWRDRFGRDWAYLAWQGTAPGVVTGRVFAVYGKQGAADSASPYDRKAVVQFQTDPRVLAPLLQRAEMIGDNLAKLSQDITNLFDNVTPAAGAGVADLVSAVLRGGRGTADDYNNLVLLSRMHPAINFALGTAHAEPLPFATNTFELRLWDPARLADIAVVGRVTVVANQPVVLPAPGAPVGVPDASARGDLNARLRWATPDALRRLSLLNHGYNVYRMTTNFAVANGYHTTPPSPSVLTNLAASNPNVRRVNNVPILAGKNFTAATAPDLVADPATFFVADDNRRFEPGRTNFLNGDTFYYFVTARDILGRDGLVSPGTRIVICDRMPPPVPRQVRVRNDYRFLSGAPRQRLSVWWQQNTNSAAETTVAYHIYRWSSITQMNALAGNVISNRIAIVPHIPGSRTNAYVDLGAGAPVPSTAAGETYWYTVRAQDNGVCGTNLSGNSAPAFGVLRDRLGPDSQGGFIQISCLYPFVLAKESPLVPNQPVQDACLRYEVACTPNDARLEWAEFAALTRSAAGPSQSNFLGRITFPGMTGRDAVAQFCHTNLQFQSQPPTFYCRVATAGGQVSAWAALNGTVWQDPTVLQRIQFAAGVATYPSRPGGECFRHEPRPPGETNVRPVEICFNTATNSLEWRVYRRVDNGPLTLISQGTNLPTGFICTLDDVMPVNPGSLCYFVQLLDEHGNASPLQRVGCTLFSGPLPTPVLSPIEPAGTGAANAQMCLDWFCPTFGVERFEVWISGPVGPNPSPNLVNTNTSTRTYTVTLDSGPQELPWNVFRSTRVGPAFGNGAAFRLKVDVEVGPTYTVIVRAVGADGSVGTNFSKPQQFAWSIPTVVTQAVPWPSRALPVVTNGISPRLGAFRLTNAFFNGTGVRIGVVEYKGPTQGGLPVRPYATPGTNDPVSWLFTNSVGQSVLPVALYRVQVPNANYPVVSGDVVQVSPLMESIAYGLVPYSEFVGTGPAAAIYDPFILVRNETPAGSPDRFFLYGIYLTDTQPVVLGAAYRYLLVRFKENREIDRIIPTNDVEVTP